MTAARSRHAALSGSQTKAPGFAGGYLLLQILSGTLTSRTVLLIATEHALMVLAVVAAATIRLSAVGILAVGVGLVWRASLIAAVLQVCLHYCDLYQLRTLRDRQTVAIGLLRALGFSSLVLAFLYFWIPGLIVGRGVLVIASVLIIAIVGGWRSIFGWVLLRLKPRERLLIIGTGQAAVVLARELHERRSELGVELAGFVDSDASLVGTSLVNPGVIGTVDEIPMLVQQHRVDRVVVSLADARGNLSMDQLLYMKLYRGVRFDHLATVYEQYTGKIAVENLRPSWLLFSPGFRQGGVLAASKRTLDVMLGGLGLVIGAPVLMLVALVLKLTSAGPILYRQRRVGKNGALITIFKFRSMAQDAEANTGARWATRSDPRVTPLGRFLRRSRLDELPQFWNVLRGDMSFVGPRPERPEFQAELVARIPYYDQRHVVRPGLTGWAQIRHQYGSSVDDSMRKLQYDLFYIKHLSLAFDLLIILETIKIVLVRRGS